MVERADLVCRDRPLWPSISLEIEGLQLILEVVLDDRDFNPDRRSRVEHVEGDQAYDRAISKRRTDLA